MKEKLNENIINHLMKHDKYVSADYLSKVLGVNEKTIRRRIKQMNDGNLEKIGKIESKKGEGYCLVIYDREAFGKYYDYYIAEVQINNPQNRCALIYEYIFENIIVSTDQLLDNFYISLRTLMHDINAINEYAKHVRVKIVQNKNKEYSIEGDEYHIRNICLKLIYDSSMVRKRRRDSRKEKNEYIHIIQNILYEEEIFINKHALDAIVNYIIISIAAIGFGRTLNMDVNIEEKDMKLLDVSLKFHKEITNKFPVKFPYKETLYLANFLKSVLPLEMISIEKESDATYQLALNYLQIIEEVNNRMGFETLSDEMKDDCVKFLYSLISRVKYDIQRREMIYLDIETTHSQAYCISKIMFKEIEKVYDIQIQKEEIAYFSLVINNYYFLSNEVRKKVLAILPSDYTVARICERELRHFSLHDVDIMTYGKFLNIQDELENKYALVISPVGYRINMRSTKTYNFFDIFTKSDFTSISRILSCMNYKQLLTNLFLIEDIEAFGNIESIQNFLEKEEYYTRFLDSYICFSKESVKTIGYRINTINFQKVIIFVINCTLAQNEVFDLLKVALDTIIRFSSKGEVLDKEKLIEYYCK